MISTAIKPVDDIVFLIAEKGYQGPLEIAGHQQHVGRVAAVGPGKLYTGQDGKQYRRTPDIQAGDRVLFSWRAGMEEQVGGVEYLVMREGDIMAVLDDDANIGLTENRRAWNV